MTSMRPQILKGSTVKIKVPGLSSCGHDSALQPRHGSVCGVADDFTGSHLTAAAALPVLTPVLTSWVTY
ncbi:hypothetical protein GDO78_012505 [Eleutherodactylus coqui]|uniref:Uncharacterized protein n=1 Tax=Eleutherodactylus coqui TaxID=57060 RepID=A0A8J6F1X5_ELECQ|nr:hypothetical protein GDO78_012505 [Eleutherodactylus coqui]KAG9478876.1 hypothetical protein GDO78_012505 [Eleutherodactylus coqui]